VRLSRPPPAPRSRIPARNARSPHRAGSPAAKAPASTRAALGDRYAATDARASTHAQAQAVYRRHVAVARVALRGERGAAQKLDLANSRKRTQAGWLIQAQQFYTNTLGDSAIAQKLAAYGIAREQLVDAQRMVAAVAATLPFTCRQWLLITAGYALIYEV
jgi:hypothetical protein